MRKLLKCGQPARESRPARNCDERAKIGAQRGPAPGTQVARRLIARLYRSDLLAHGFTIEMLIVLVGDGLATATPQIVHAGRRPIEVVRVGITDAGRQALDG